MNNRLFLFILIVLICSICIGTPYSVGQDLEGFEVSTSPLVIRCRFLRGGNSDFYYDVLKQSLHLTEKHYGTYRIETRHLSLSSTVRKIIEIQSSRLFNLETLPATKQIEEKLLVIPFPLFRGLFGLRILLGHPGSIDSIGQCKTLEDLQEYSVGIGKGWNDVLIFQHNLIPVSIGEDTASLYKMLLKQRFDFFQRGYLEHNLEKPMWQGKAVQPVESVLLYYPHSYSFVVSHRDKEMADRILMGLRLSVEDGSYDVMLKKHYEKEMLQLPAETRRVIQIENPLISERSLQMHHEYMLPELKRLIEKE